MRLLDEPDNHLDIAAKQQLAAAMGDYQGALLVVSLDDNFVIESRVEQQLWLTP